VYPGADGITDAPLESMRLPSCLVLAAFLTTAPAAARASAAWTSQAGDEDARAAPAPLAVAGVIARLAAATFVVLAERPGAYSAHEDPAPCDQW
jgi:hypothetical protein